MSIIRKAESVYNSPKGVVFFFHSVITMITSAIGGGGGEEHKSGDSQAVDLRTLRAVRVLRPLKLVSGIPSKKIFHGL